MCPAEFTAEAIVQAGRDLQAAGCNITGFALHRKVGGGNPLRLKQVWDEHLAGHSAAPLESVAAAPLDVAEDVVAVTRDLTERLTGLVLEVNEKLVNAAERRVHEVVRAADKQREQAERELADAGRTVNELEAKLHEANATADALQRRNAEGIALNRAQAGELATVREDLTRIAQSAKTAGEQHAAERVRLHTAMADIATERDQARAAVQAAQEKAREPMRLIQEQEAALDALRAKVDEAEREGVRLDALLGNARQETAEAERRAAAAEARALRTAGALEASQAAHAAAERVAADLRLEVAAERAAHVADIRSIIERLPSDETNRL
jgi:colicin import membrane protein